MCKKSRKMSRRRFSRSLFIRAPRLADYHNHLISDNFFPFIIIALFAFMKHQRIQNHLSRSAHLQMSQIKTIFTNFSYNQNTPQKYKISSDAQKFSGQSQNEKKCAQP